MREFWNVAKNEETGQAELRIDGPITMEQGFWDWLFDKPDRSATALEKAIKSFNGKDLTVWINSNGGECFAASVIYTALKNYKGKVTVKIDGTAISAASVIAMAGDEVLMSPTSVMMIHNPLTIAQGEVKDMQKAIDILSTVKDSILNAYSKKTKKPRDEISKMMDEETWMSADTAIQSGFADGKLFENDDLSVSNDFIKGARMVYNSIDKEELAIKLKQFLEENPQNLNPVEDESEVDIFILKNKIEIERMRY